MTSTATFAEVWSRWGSPRRAVAVVAHPDDESFGLGAVLSGLVDVGADVGVVCLTHGEASTLGATSDLGARRDRELRAAAIALGVDEVALFDFPDGQLAAIDDAILDSLVDEHAGDADLLVVFEPGGVTGHPDHRAATAAAERVAARRSISVLEWGVNPNVAAALRDELGVAFVPLTADPADDVVDVVIDRRRQRAAMACHGSQATDNVVLHRRLALQGSFERIRRRAPCGGGRV